MATSIALLLLYLNIQLERYSRLIESENEIIRTNSALTISLLQPKVVKESLESIKIINKDDNILKTNKSLNIFEDYLIYNLQIFETTSLVNFKDVLQHIKNYVYLKQLVMNDRLVVNYNIAISDFMLPSLIVQPLVDNAIRHGVDKKSRGGTIEITTKYDDDHIYIEIKDDGLGFYTDILKRSDVNTPGFDNVKNRLEINNIGTLNVKSYLSIGTTCEITLDKKKAQNY